MSARKMIQENGMSMKIIQFCNESKNFMKKFLEIVGFDTLGDVDYIEFTGDTPTPHGKPDITIRFNNGEYCIIEVKTDEKTDFQDFQTEGDGYAKLIVEKNKVYTNQIKPHVEKHFCFLLDPIHCKTTGNNITINYKNSLSLQIPVISWGKIYEAVSDFGNRSLARDIEENVSGIKKDTTTDNFSAYDLFLLDNSELLYYSKKKLNDFNFNQVNIVKNKLQNILLDPSILNSLICYEVTLRGCYFSYGINKNDKVYGKIFLGFSPELLITNKVITEKVAVKDFLCSVAVDKELVDFTKLNNINYCEDIYRWIYLPVAPSCLQSKGDDIFNPNNFEKFDCSLDICHSLITLYRMSQLINESKDKILEELKRKLSLTFDLETDKYYYLDNKKDLDLVVGYWIKNIKDNHCIFFGLTPNVFEHEMDNTNIDELKRPNYFSCVAIYDIDKQGKLINNGAFFEEETSIYFPISKKVLCTNDFVDAYVKEVVRLILEACKEYWEE